MMVNLLDDSNFHRQTAVMTHPLDCSTKNVNYGIECTLCGLLYVGETRQALRSRMSQHRYDAKDPKYRIIQDLTNFPLL
jgi:hypothetical protein